MKTLVTLMLMAVLAMAADYGHMSTDDMMQMQGNVPVDQRAEFRTEMQKRMQGMTLDERQRYQGMMGNGMMMNYQGMMGNNGINNRGQGMMKQMMVQKFNLTQEQQKKLDKIVAKMQKSQKEYRQSIINMLTPEQKDQFIERFLQYRQGIMGNGMMGMMGGQGMMGNR
ncbi:DUF1104 domain-containing protein [Sulfurimonas sp.]|uniref:DUF1104 domain-containing protein n=1 Tax=Sulfurimonas sp. TaxID=2022749 RepID=UPI003567A724